MTSSVVLRIFVCFFFSWSLIWIIFPHSVCSSKFFFVCLFLITKEKKNHTQEQTIAKITCKWQNRWFLGNYLYGIERINLHYESWKVCPEIGWFMLWNIREMRQRDVSDTAKRQGWYKWIFKINCEAFVFVS